MYTNQYRVNGNLVFYDDTGLTEIQELWVDAIGRGVVKDLNHFTTYSPDEWTITGTADGDVYTEAAQGGILVLEVGAVDDARSQVQRPALPFKLTASDPLYFGCRWRIDDATECDIAVGLCINDGAIIGGVTDGVYFRKTDDADTIFIVTEKDSTETETTTTISAVDDTFIVTEFYWNGGVASTVTITSVGTTATVTNTAHGLTTGWTVTISGANEADYNGTFVVTVVDVDTYTYTMGDDPASPATGTIIETLNAITGYVNGVLKVTTTTNIPDDEELAVVMSLRNGSTTANYLSIDWVRCIQCLEAE